MCGRQALFANDDAIASAAGVPLNRWKTTTNSSYTDKGSTAANTSYTDKGSQGRSPSHRYRKSFNNGPMRRMPVLTAERSSKSGSATRYLSLMQWGIHTDAEHKRLTINARDDTLKSNGFGLWNSLKNTQRCLIPVQGYFEWLDSAGDKAPHFITLPSFTLPRSFSPDSSECELDADLSSSIMWLAGLYQTPAQDSLLKVPAFVIATIASKGSNIEWLHDRMPVIFKTEEDRDAWLDPNVPFSSVSHLMKPYEGDLQCWQVHPFMNKIANDTFECIVPVEQKSGTLFQFFKKSDGAHIKKQDAKVEAEEPFPSEFGYSPSLYTAALDNKTSSKVHKDAESAVKMEPTVKMESAVKMEASVHGHGAKRKFVDSIGPSTETPAKKNTSPASKSATSAKNKKTAIKSISSGKEAVIPADGNASKITNYFRKK
ncbi:hypothetical protein HDU81_000999 [Chytriomyces hyalinus]|nr:hypothetical protein HDU81_000999 [Chytriomyces hyalinus]